MSKKGDVTLMKVLGGLIISIIILVILFNPTILTIIFTYQTKSMLTPHTNHHKLAGSDHVSFIVWLIDMINLD